MSPIFSLYKLIAFNKAKKKARSFFPEMSPHPTTVRR
jgi:hypothetical protein